MLQPASDGTVKLLPLEAAVLGQLQKTPALARRRPHAQRKHHHQTIPDLTADGSNTGINRSFIEARLVYKPILTC